MLFLSTGPVRILSIRAAGKKETRPNNWWRVETQLDAMLHQFFTTSSVSLVVFLTFSFTYNIYNCFCKKLQFLWPSFFIISWPPFDLHLRYRRHLFEKISMLSFGMDLYIKKRNTGTGHQTLFSVILFGPTPPAPRLSQHLPYLCHSLSTLLVACKCTIWRRKLTVGGV